MKCTEMAQSSCKRDTKSKSHPGMKLAPVRVFSCKHPLRARNKKNKGDIFLLEEQHENFVAHVKFERLNQ